MRVPLSSIALAATLTSVSSAHTVFTTLFINGENQGDGTCVRMPTNPSNCTYPISSIESPDMACGVDGETAVAFTCPAPGNATLTFEFREYADGSSPGSIDPSHKGPCSVYLKSVSDMATDSATGDGWFKIWDDGYDEDTQQWCTEKLILNNGLLSVALPETLPGGYYLVRPELLALLDADKGDPQFYVGCAQVFVQGSNSTLDIPTEYQATIPGYVQASDPSVTFNIYQDPMALPYPIPGPPVWVPTADAAVNNATGGGSVTQTQGVIPADCLIKNANWCGIEVDGYSNSETGCWNASANCFAQEKECYATAPPTGSRGCATWDGKCTTIQSSCFAGDFTGPPTVNVKLQDPSALVPGPIPPAAVQVAASGSVSVNVNVSLSLSVGVSVSVSPATGTARHTTAIATPVPLTRRHRLRRGKFDQY